MMSSRKSKQDHYSILSEPVLKLPGKGKNTLTWGHLFAGAICFGSAGSGKTSGFLTYILQAMLQSRQKPGGLIITVKKSDRVRIEKLVRDAGRGDDLVIISPEESVKLNVIEHELLRRGRDHIEYNQVVDLMMECFTLSENFQAGGASSSNGDRFWDKQLRLQLIRSLMLLVLAKLPVTVENIRKLIVDSFGDGDQFRYVDIWERLEDDDRDVRSKALTEYEDWRASNFFLAAFDVANSRDDMTANELHILELIGDYFLKTWPKISEKTRAIVEASVYGLSEPFMTGILRSHFSADEMSTEALPENCYKKGAIILIDIPIKEYGVSSVYAGGMYKKFFQLEMERRVVEQEENPRPVFYFIDEYHLVTNALSDDKFHTTCRSTMTAAILSTQTINNLKAVMGQNAEFKTKTLLANLSTQVFCANMDSDTNVYAAELIGKGFIDTTSNTIDSNDRTSRSFGQSHQYIVPPSHFMTLKSGGKENNYKVESIIVSRSMNWSTQENFLEGEFDQRGPNPPLFGLFKSSFQ